ncbi:MAG: ABC transporter permease [Planctomycetaceae bacterium]|nr:ABC transporter permease [Planctomycetaceae bacterium]
MKSSDVLGMAFHNLRQRRLRTLLNLIGVVTGCVVLMMTAAGMTGVRQAILVLFDSIDQTRQIYLYGQNRHEEPPEGEIVVDAAISEPRRTRIRAALVSEWNQKRSVGLSADGISPGTIEQIRKVPHVTSVIPEAFVSCVVDSGQDLVTSALSPWKLGSSSLRQGLLAGTLPEENDHNGVLVNEFTAWKMGYRNDSDLPKLVGQTLKIEYRVSKLGVANMYNALTAFRGAFSGDGFQKQTEFLQTLLQLLGDLDKTSLSEEQKTMLRELFNPRTSNDTKPEEITLSREFVVRGVVYSNAEDPLAALFRMWFQNSGSGLLVHPDVATEIYLSMPEATHFYNASVFVDRSQNLREVTQKLSEMKLECLSSLVMLDSIDYQVQQGGWIVIGIAAAILLTSAIGISNTLMLSIVERTPEFGIMKSLGARDGDILKLMIAEGVILGFLGAAIAILLSLTLGFCGQSILKYYVESRTQTELAGSLFQFSLLHTGLILLISVFLCVTASILPAWRAARLDPVVAMRRT